MNIRVLHRSRRPYCVAVPQERAGLEAALQSYIGNLLPDISPWAVPLANSQFGIGLPAWFWDRIGI
jgi:hypothetical protein